MGTRGKLTLKMGGGFDEQFKGRHFGEMRGVQALTDA